MAKEKGFYYQYYQAFIYSLIIALFLLISMVGVVLYQLFHKPLPVFQAIAPSNQRMMLTAFTEPNFLPATLLRWANKAAVASYTFDFVNYRQQIANAAPFYTESGWEDYQNSIARLIEDITARKLFVNSVVAGAPVIAWQGNRPGQTYTWQIQMPFLVTYQSAETINRDNFFVVMTVVRIPTTEDPTGIGINRFVMR